MSLNKNTEREQITAEDKKLIREFFARGGRVTSLPPGNAIDTEAVRSTNELISERRKSFKEKQRGKRAAEDDETE